MNDSLFDLPVDSAPQTPAEMPIRDEQLDAIRQAFFDAGIESQTERQALVESCCMRPVGGLRDLTAIEARRVLSRIQDKTQSLSKPGGSAWDSREEDTWIDKL